jgi:hypothetical protein
MDADKIIVKPFEAGKLAELLRDKMVARKPAARVKKVKSCRDTAALYLRS